jgi:hypothetical protein
VPNVRVSGAGAAIAAARLSDLFADPFLRRAFRRAERDGGQACAIPAPCPKPDLAGGAVALPEPAEEAAHG